MAYFGARFFGPRYFGDRFFASGGAITPSGDTIGDRYVLSGIAAVFYALSGLDGTITLAGISAGDHRLSGVTETNEA